VAELRRAANRIAIDYGKQRLEVERLRYENETLREQLQGKIHRQAKAIIRLEAKVRELGGKPHEEVRPDDAVGGAEAERPPLDAVAKKAGFIG
jgi:hypothetical protein